MSVLEVHDVSIRYMMGDFKDIGLKEYVMRRLSGNYHVTEFWADHHITFSLEKGDMLGIIGTNGAGKSTLLKAISGIMEPTGGYVRREGNIAALLELASGFDGDLTVRENAYLRGAMLGYTRKFMDEKYPEIIEFAELQDFQDRPFKQLSSGMMSRLAFSVASLVHPDILILDEVLSVGDGAFRRKSEAKMREIIDSGATTILVSHSVEQVREMSNKVLWIEKGNQIGFGDTSLLCDLYQSYLDGMVSLEEAKVQLEMAGSRSIPRTAEGFQISPLISEKNSVTLTQKSFSIERLQKPEYIWTLSAFVIFFLLSMLRFSGFGLTYFHQLDDYIQYHNYPTANFLTLALQEGLLISRPLANIADYFVWGPMFSYMMLAVAILTGIYTATMLILRKLLQRYFEVSPFFLVIVCLLPLGIEGLYWVSASTRIVLGLFFAVLAAWYFVCWIDKGKICHLFLYGILQILPFGFYEQCAVLSMTFVLGIGLLEWKQHHKRFFAAFWSIGCMIGYLLFVRCLSIFNPYATRMELIFPVSCSYYTKIFLPDILNQISKVFFEGCFLISGKGFLRGLSMMTQPTKLLWLLLVLVCCTGLFWLLLHTPARKENTNKVRGIFFSFVSGFLLALAPITIFFVLANPYFPLRNAVTSFAGIALMIDAFLQLLFRKDLKKHRLVLSILSVCTVILFSIASLTEIYDYRETNRYDHQIANIVLTALDRDNIPSNIRVGILNIEPTYIPNQSFRHAEHIVGCTSSDWAFTGLLSSIKPNQPSVTPLGSQVYAAWNREVNHPITFQWLYYYDGVDLLPVVAKQDKEKYCGIYLTSGELLGIVWEDESQCGYFALAQ